MNARWHIGDHLLASTKQRLAIILGSGTIENHVERDENAVFLDVLVFGVEVHDFLSDKGEHNAGGFGRQREMDFHIARDNVKTEEL